MGTKCISLHLPCVPTLFAFLLQSSIRTYLPLLCDSHPTPWSSVAGWQHHRICLSWTFQEGDANLYPPWCPMQCLAHSMPSGNICWYGIFLTGWAVLCRNSAYRNSLLASLTLRELISQMETVCRIFSSLSPFVNLGLCSVVTSASLYLPVPSLRSASTLQNASSFCSVLWEQGLCSAECSVRTGERVAKAEGCSVHYVLFS